VNADSVRPFAPASVAGDVAIVYLHGFASSPASAKATAMARAIDALPASARPRFAVPALDHHPARALAQVEDLVRAERFARATLTFVGSSLGGFYAVALASRLGTRAVLVNPAIRPYDDLRPYAGPQTNLYTGETFVVTPEHFDALAALRVPRLPDPRRFFLLVQTGDEVLDWRESVAYCAGAWQHVEGGGDHGFARFDAQVPAVLRFAGVRVP